MGIDSWAPTCLFTLDSLEGSQGLVLRELKAASSSPHSLATAGLTLCRFPEWVAGKEGCGESFGVRGGEWGEPE